MNPANTTPLWWERPDLRYTNRSLSLEGHDLSKLADSMGTPLFVYSAARITDNLSRLHEALKRTGCPFKMYYAMKANRFAPVLTHIKATGLCGIDACSPEEVYLARSCGFSAEDISFTATSVSNQDLERLLKHDDMIINCDSISMIKKIGQRCPGRNIGIRLNPSLGVGYGSSELLRYSGDQATKFGIYNEQFLEALAAAKSYDLRITRIHFHTGCGYLSEQLDDWSRIIEVCLTMARPLEHLTTVNLGGGLGLPHTQSDRPINLKAWADVIRKNFHGTGLGIEVEPGDYIIKDSGALLLDVTMVEKKKDTLFVGLNGGFNLAMEPAFYDLPCEPLVCRLENDPETAFSPENLTPVTLAGNINEALDIWADNHPLPPVFEGDTIALINAGGYASAMSSNHCLRGHVREMILI